MTRLDEIKARLESVMKSDLPPNLAFTREQIAFVEDSPFAIGWLLGEVERQAALIQMAAGLISTMDQFRNWLTEDVYTWVLNGMPEATDRSSVSA